MGFVGDYQSAKAGRKNALAQGAAAKDANYKNAEYKEAESASMLDQQARSMQVQRANQSQATAQARALRGGGGLTTEGSGLMAETAVYEQYEQAIANQINATSMQDQSNRHAANVMRWEGDSAMVQAQNQANQYKAMQKGVVAQGVMQVGGAVAGAAIGGFAGAGKESTFSWEHAKSGGMMGFNLGGMASTVIPGTNYNSAMGSKYLASMLNYNDAPQMDADNQPIAKGGNWFSRYLTNYKTKA